MQSSHLTRIWGGEGIPSFRASRTAPVGWNWVGGQQVRVSETVGVEFGGTRSSPFRQARSFFLSSQWREGRVRW